MAEWNPERVVDEALATQLIESQFPELRPVTVKHVGQGWDNIVYSANGSWFFRFPQRQVALDGVRREIDCLPLLSKELEGLPTPVLVGAPVEIYPWPFFGFKPVEGREACDVTLEKSDREALALPVARFLKRLHAPRLHSRLAARLPVDPIGRLKFPARAEKTLARLASCRARLGDRLPISISDAERLLSDVDASVKLAPTAVVHGDLHFRHLMIRAGVTGVALSGVIDWGDLQLNDPAVDLQLAWSFFPPAARERFWMEYGSVSPQQRAQSRAVSLFLALALLDYAVDSGLASVEREARLSLAHLVQS